MITLLVLGHGNFATGMSTSIEMILGSAIKDKIHWMDFSDGSDQESLTNNIKQVITQVASVNEGPNHIVCLVDLPGGTPFKLCGTLKAQHANIHVISGVNIPMILSAAFNLDVPVDEMITAAIEDAKDSMALLVFKDSKHIDKKNDSTGGI